jgi:hypothetical protein
MSLSVSAVPGNIALSTLARLRREAALVGKCAFLIGDRESLERVEEQAEFNPPNLVETIQRAGEFDIDAWLADRKGEQDEVLDDEAPDFIGEWPGELDHGKMMLHTDVLTGKPRAEIFIATVSVEKSWQIPAALGYGGWNDCPDPIVHTAMARRWAERYDAELIGVSGDIMEWEVRKPPTTQAEAMELAWEQFLYCTDIVTQGVESISALGGILLNSPYWFFWWD